MNSSKQFDSTQCPLEGLNIIEAGAGTGKTYNIQNLFARMIVEKGFPIDSILVVTYTEAATKELKDRIRSILVQIQNYYIKGSNNVEPRVKAIADTETSSIEIKKKRIDSALRNFDTAAIFTIHGFCHRLLNDFSFESNILFNLELETNPEPIIQDIIEDFWRIENYSSNDMIKTSILTANKITVESLKRFIRECISQASIKLEPKIALDSDFRKFKLLLSNLNQVFNKNELIQLFPTAVFNQARYKPAQIETILNSLEALIKGVITSKSFEYLKKFTPDKIRAGIKKGKETLFCHYDHPVFKLAEDLCEYEHIVTQYASFVKTKCASYFFEEYLKRKQKLNIQTFDDLLNKVNDFIQVDGSKLKAATIAKYQAAMIDEFQDTDAVQYSIFKKLFINTGKPIFLVGDPKQAIYAFRGGDIFTYQKAKTENKNATLYSLSTNWRSADNMVGAVNEIFLPNSLNPLPFADSSIEFLQADSSKQKNDLQLKDKPDSTPLKLINISGEHSSGDLVQYCAETTAYKINVILHDNNTKISDNDSQRNIKPGDIAILVNKHAQAQIVKKELNCYNIPSVLQATGSVFESYEAEQIEYILKAVANPGNTGLITSALLTDIIGFTPDKIVSLASDENPESFVEYENILALFKDLNNTCRERSFVEMFNKLLSEFKIRENVLSQIDGERKITNIIHLSEILHEKELSSKLGLNSLIIWLNKQRDKASREDKDEYEIRLDTDREAVKIMTVHKSKGLEFPIVFCPFIWSKNAVQTSLNNFVCKYHKSGETFINLENSKETLSKNYDEALQELIRLFYVAVTRAKYQCYLLWGTIRQSGRSNPPSSALDYIFKLNDNISAGSKNIALTISANTSRPSIQKSRHITMSNEDSSQPMILETESSIEKAITDIAALSYKTFDISLIDNTWKISSFSGLAPHMGHSETIYQDNDENDNNNTEETPIDNSINIFNFPAGAKTGTCWHSIFENLDFTSDEEKIIEVVNKQLNEFALDTAYNGEIDKEKQDCVLGMVKNVLSTKLPTLNGISLSSIDNSKRLTELEFNFPLNNGFYTEQISDIVFEYSKTLGISEKIKNWNQSFIKGYMTGFIDLIFMHNNKYYILDWKSNKLDGRPESFGEEGMKKEIAGNYYFLQYLIYTVALNRFLKQRLPNYSYEEHFGGIYYVFLRGADNDLNSTKGFFYERPEKELIEKLSAIF